MQKQCNNMKRCRSADRIEAASSACHGRARQRYKGRYSLQQQTPANQSNSQTGASSSSGFGHPKQRRRRYRMRSPRRRYKCDYFEEMDEICAENFQCLESTGSSLLSLHTNSSSADEHSIPAQLGAAPDCEAGNPPKCDVLELLRNEMDKFRRKKRMVIRTAIEDEQRHKFGDLLWFHLRAFFAGRPMDKAHIRHSLNAQDRAIMQQRQQQMTVVEEIVAFKWTTSSPKESDESSLYTQIYTPRKVADHKEAIHSVSVLLERWDQLAELYPHLAQMQRSIETELLLFGNDGLFRNVDTLQVGLFFTQIEGRHRQSSTTTDSIGSPLSPNGCPLWPWHDLDPGQPVQPQIAEQLQKILHRVVGRSLRLRGMLSVLRRLHHLTRPTLERACLSLLQPRLYAQIAGKDGLGNYVKQLKEKFGANEDLRTMQTEHQHFASLQLPSFRPHFHFLLRLPVQLVTAWLEMRSEKVVSSDWDMLTLDTLVEDSHDCLEESIRVKNDFLLMWSLTNATSGFDPDSAQILAKFDTLLERVFHNFLSYIRLWAQTAAKLFSGSGIEWNERVVAKMNAEWELARKWGAKVCGGELAAARMFCNIGRDLLDLMVRRYLNEKFDSVELTVLEANECEEDEEFLLIDDSENMKTASSVFMLCRAFKEMIRQLRDRSLRSLAFIRTLSNSLEFCARYTWDSVYGCDELVAQLLTGGRHVVVSFPDNADTKFLVLCARGIANQFEQIDHLLLCATTSSSDRPNPVEIRQQKGAKEKQQRGQQQQQFLERYLLLIPSLWLDTRAEEYPEKIMVKPSLGAWNTLQHLIADNGIYLIAGDREELEFGQKLLATYVSTSSQPPYPAATSAGHLVLDDDFCTCNDELAEEIGDLKRAAFECVREVWTCSRDLGEYVLNGKRMEDLPPGERVSLKGTLAQAWSAAFECQKELSHVVSYPMHGQFCTELLQSMAQWAAFVEETLSAPDACTRCALDQLAILTGISRKIFTSGKVQEGDMQQFVELVRTVTRHIQAVENASAATKTESEMQNSLNDLKTTKPETTVEQQQPSSAEQQQMFHQFGQIRPLQRRLSVGERVREGIVRVEERREQKLFGQRRIGHVLMERERRSDLIKTHFFTPRKAPFEWQRLENSELGSGSFGSVFLAMNLRDKFLLAVKQIQVRHDNEPSLRAMIDEVEILRTLNHPNLVRYYGVEVHKTEVLIFMEYCSEGTLARVCREGLELAQVRRYTHYLFQAIAYIHEHGIVHRDIKTANIFLAAGDRLKLGDFGSSFRLDGTRTEAGEMLSFVGTVRYMAPEVQTSGAPVGGPKPPQPIAEGQQTGGSRKEHTDSLGYGRAVDVWSSGCVVLEMLTGKKPFHYLNHEFQVIYQLGMGIGPRIPEEVRRQEIAHSFLRACFVVEARHRPSARELLQHPFANILPQELISDENGL